MNIRIGARLSAIATTSAIVLVLAGCGTVVKPDDLKRPTAMRCIEVPAGIESRTTPGITTRWIMTLAPGAYVSERESADGTYYRGPYGAIATSMEGVNRPPTITDGGIFVPSNEDRPPVVYRYIASKDPLTAPPKSTNCADTVAIVVPGSEGTSQLVYRTKESIERDTPNNVSNQPSNNGFEAGLQAGISGRVTGGQVTGAGVAGGAVGGIIVAALIQMDVGKIEHLGYLTDDKLAAMLADLKRHAKPIKVVPAPATN